MNESAPNGFAAHVAAENDLRTSHAAQAAALVPSPLEQRRLSPEVARLNDIAQIEIWGTNGRTAGLVDPETGNPLTQPIKGVISELRDNPNYGDRQAAENSGDRRLRRAADYETEVLGLVDSGFELCQAKLIMDLRQRDEQAAILRTAKYIAEGLPAAEAEQKVHDIYTEKDTRRLEIIETQGIFSHQEYAAAIRHKKFQKPAAPTPETPVGPDSTATPATSAPEAGDSPADQTLPQTPAVNSETPVVNAETPETSTDPADPTDSADPADPKSPTTPPAPQPTPPRERSVKPEPTTPEEAAKQTAIKAKHQRDAERAQIEHDVRMLSREAEEAAEEYARLSAGRGRRTRINPWFSKTAVRNARAKWEAKRAALIKAEVYSMFNHAPNGEIEQQVLQNNVGALAIIDAARMVQRIQNHRLVATGRYKVGVDGELVKIEEPKSGRKHHEFHFSRWWEGQNRGLSRDEATKTKIQALAKIGAGAAIPAAMAGTVMIGPLLGVIGGTGAAVFAGATAASRVGKGYLAYAASKKKLAKNEEKTGWYRQDLEEGLRQAAVNLAYDENGMPQPINIGDTIDRQTELMARRNNRRLVFAMGASAVGGTVGAVGSMAVTELGLAVGDAIVDAGEWVNSQT